MKPIERANQPQKPQILDISGDAAGQKNPRQRAENAAPAKTGKAAPATTGKGPPPKAPGRASNDPPPAPATTGKVQPPLKAPGKASSNPPPGGGADLQPELYEVLTKLRAALRPVGRLATEADWAIDSIWPGVLDEVPSFSPLK